MGWNPAAGSPRQGAVRPKRGAATTLLIAGFATAIGPILPWVSFFGINANAFTLGEFADGLDAAESTVTTWRVIAIGLLLGGLVCGALGIAARTATRPKRGVGVTAIIVAGILVVLCVLLLIGGMATIAAFGFWLTIIAAFACLIAAFGVTFARA